jgi:hypothetical protein
MIKSVQGTRFFVEIMHRAPDAVRSQILGCASSGWQGNAFWAHSVARSVLAGLSEDRSTAREIVDSYGLDELLMPLASAAADSLVTMPNEALENALRTLYNIAIEGAWARVVAVAYSTAHDGDPIRHRGRSD